ncbi:hypothetical protein [Mumia sp.]|uniref:hypothetical protein n=1 Tax=Mumia sp. TaxID=1965300 RepID=UPI00262C77E0|nr:hypothetical protein [Mumia sp.]MDD9347173.1 hypothetical protein [Mumia sp.]
MSRRDADKKNGPRAYARARLDKRRGKETGLRLPVTTALLIVYAVLALIGLALLFIAPYWFGFLRGVAYNAAAPVTLTAVLLVLLALVTDLRGRRMVVLVIALTVGWVAFGVYSTLTVGWHAAKGVYEASVVETDDPQGGYKVREPYEVARSNVSQGIGDVIASDRATAIKHVDGEWTAIVPRKGWNKGYAKVVSRDTDGEYTSCAFDDEHSGVKFGGKFSHNLGRAITGQVIDTWGRFAPVVWDESDMFGLCDGDGARIVVPLTRWSGHWASHQVPAGVAIVETDGSVRVDKTAKGIDGPVYPISLAAEQRESTRAAGSFWDYVRHRSGYADSDAVGEAGAANTGEFALVRAKGGMDYVTPLTRASSDRSGSQSIVGVSTIAADRTEPGRLATLTVHKVPAESGLRGRISKTLTNFQNVSVLATRKATMLEVVPTSADMWVATLGMEAADVISPAYRIEIPSEGEACLKALDGRTIQCGAQAGVDGNGAGPVLAPSDGADPSGGALADRSDAELLKDLADITAELQRREQAGPAD